MIRNKMPVLKAAMRNSGFGFSLFLLVSCTTMGTTFHSGSNEEISAKMTVVEYIHEKIDLSKEYVNQPCYDEKVWWCVGRLFTNNFEIEYLDSAYDYIFYSVKFDNGNHFLISTEHNQKEWKVSQKPMMIGEKAYYLSTHTKGKKFKLLYVKYTDEGTVELDATIEK